MDWGRARYRQAHKLPPQNWEVGVLVLGIFVILTLVALGCP